MATLAEVVELVIGVDTHKDTHTAAVVQAVSGAVVDQVTVPATPAGYQQLLRFADRQDGRRVWAIGGTGGYGAGLTRFLHGQAERAVELDRPKRAARRSAVQAATDAQRQLHALVVAAPDSLRGRLRGLTTPRLVSTCTRLRQQATWDTETCATAASLRALAHRIQLLNSEVAEHTRAITTLVRVWRPDLLTRTGVGPIVAAIVLCAWSHPGRCPSDDASCSDYWSAKQAAGS
jgi:hypothetical protein